MSIQTLSNSIISQKQTETLEAQNLRKTVAFRDITLIDTDTIQYNGTSIKITKNAFKNILSLLGMSQSFAKKFEELFTKEAKSQFINTMKNAMASNSGKLSNVNLVLNPISKSVIAVTKEDRFSISNKQFMGVAENIIDNHSMEVSDWSINPTTGIVSINAFNPNANFAVNGLSDEVFTGGVTFQNSPTTGLQVLPYVNRQWCTNGLTTAMAQEAYQLHSLDNKSMESFFENMQQLRRNNYAPEGFADRVRQANNTPASLREMQFAHGLISKHAGERAEQWVPLQENLNEYNKAGFEKLTTDQMKMAKTNQSVWSVINGVTHFSSHGTGIIDTNMQQHDEADIQTRIGNLIGKKSFDHENTMPNPFSKEQLQQTGALLN